MKVIEFRHPGAPSALQCVERPIPDVREDEVLVRAHAIGVSMTDVMIRTGVYNWMPPLPAVPGTEMSGTIENVGSAVVGLRPGQHVVVSARERKHRGGCYTEYIATPASSVFALPDGIELSQAAALANYQVAYHLLHDCARAQAGQSVLVPGAAGGVGHAIVDLARSMGLVVIALCGGARRAQFVRSLGADRVIDRNATDIRAAVFEATKGQGADIILDPVGGPTFERNFDLVARFGLIVNFGSLAGRPEGELIGTLRRHIDRCAAVRAFSMHIFDDWPQKRRDGMRWLIDRLAQGALNPRIGATMPLEEAARAHERLEAGEILGKLILKP